MEPKSERTKALEFIRDLYESIGHRNSILSASLKYAAFIRIYNGESPKNVRRACHLTKNQIGYIVKRIRKGERP